MLCLTDAGSLVLLLQYDLLQIFKKKYIYMDILFRLINGLWKYITRTKANPEGLPISFFVIFVTTLLAKIMNQRQNLMMIL
jgi:hypothetical protein